MFKNQYYYFVAGLPDFSFESTKLPFTVEEFKVMLYDELKPNDKQLIDKYILKTDTSNLLKLIANKEAEIEEAGVFTREELLTSIASIKEDADAKDRNIPYIFEFFIKRWLKEDAESENRNWEDLLTSLYMDYGIEAKNSLVSQWFTLNLNIGNVLAAIYSRKYDLEVKGVVIGNNHIAKTIRANTNSRDFGLEQELDYFETLLRISEETDIYDRERKIDKFRWDWLEENTVFDYFNVEYLFAYLCKLQILERWAQLNAEEGERVFRELIANMKKEVKLPEEE
ncbi:MAG TPA: DUF2764 family protein [Dysgonamonadaceae bacterium]|nr:DUF2764 family protein [Dysgonamonadaceae bacterium]